ncbi:MULTISPECIES: DUF1310 family protein [Streptococcus]|uniref:DUF1310 family protein n=1 Tax=Streptococcus TaxID=1301 RepID=UPI0022848F31|nr:MULTISPECIES: DUF1310 family protein [Streptococcus]MCY7023610.1 DUF1310 domain-containing protein [Streptococcus sanguinis]MDQ8691880.1 DUF1310 family protein [Streptococcus sp. IsoGale022]
MSKRRNRIMGLIGLTVLILLGGGLCLAHKNQEFRNEMTRIVHSKKVKNLIEKKLKKLDPRALTDKGKVRSYKIDDRSIRHNPMGGIMFDIIINDDPDIVGSTGLRKYGENEDIRTVGMDRSKDLQKLLGE